MADACRIEKDSLGEVRVPAGRLWGAQTQRAVENFRVSGRRMPKAFLDALAAIKWSAAKTNAELGLLDERLAEAVMAAADEVLAGRHDDEFPVDVFQTGSGTSTNMNMNEVLANLANARLGSGLGSKAPVHPNDHVNMGQSSNDVVPTALHVSIAAATRDRLIPALGNLSAALLDKSEAWDDVIKVGRTHLQDATPIRMGQVFQGYAAQVAHSCQRLSLAYDGLLEVALGGTAVGTGIGTHPEFHAKAIQHLSEKTGLPLRRARNLCEQLAGREACVFFAGALGAATRRTPEGRERRAPPRVGSALRPRRAEAPARCSPAPRSCPGR